ncbi:hypothetical protein I5M27_13720 [Adhaeribacter sp. BT258]|uniref:Outer membrane protein beta-barrel domain-containing protein n=1 Tax=Adhaeribacter terrigena TaxID=2793070 RepID=A0ABS1C411_9BACT|nr:hypothetical protein [Adhaeribacter terrigena]MBK0404048.1 hypothetical protein [Adhaeribacter terrigena]
MKNYASLLKIIFCIGMLVLLGFKGQAQQQQKGQVRNLNGGPIVEYYNAVGLRLGNQFGITGKHFMREGNAIEIIVGSHLGRKGVTGTFLYEFHRNAFEAKRLLWYYGGGGHVGYFKYNEYYEPDNNRYNRSGNFVTVGADGIIGLEYGLGIVPLAISADVKPYLNLIGGEAAGVDGAISVRYVF